MSDTILEVQHLSKSFSTTNPWGKKSLTKGISDISFSVSRGEIVGVVGQSGCGKSTLAKLILRLVEADRGQVFYEKNNIYKMNKSQFRRLRPEIQLIFQNSYDCMNPKMTVQKLLLEAILEHKLYKNKKHAVQVINNVLLECGMGSECLTRYPHELSGGQLQRIAIARVLLLRPRFIIADEVVSALDVPVQEQILELFISLQRKLQLSLLFISHDLAVIRKICDRIIVMEQGEIVEIGKTEDTFENPQHPCTRKLISSVVKFSYS